MKKKTDVLSEVMHSICIVAGITNAGTMHYILDRYKIVMGALRYPQLTVWKKLSL